MLILTRIHPQRGYFKKFCMWMYLLDFEILTFIIPNFVPFTTHQYTILYKKHPIFAQIGCFLPSFAQNTPNLSIFGALILL